jgi:1-deoxyxylulose-5-phosphate synthase
LAAIEIFGRRCIVDRRTLGRTSLVAGRIGLGCVTFGREIDEAESFRILDQALERGINLLDTSEAYGGGQSRMSRRNLTGVDEAREATSEFHSSELILGRWLASRGCRDRVIVQTKVTPPLSRQRVLESIDASLSRLAVECIDLFMFHAFDAQTPLAQSLEALSIAERAGKIRFAGCSNFSATQLREALDAARDLGLPRMDVVQSNYNLAVRDIEEALLPLCAQEGTAVETYSPLGAGFLTGKYSGEKRQLPEGSRFDLLPAHRQIYFHDTKFEVVRRLSELGARLGISPARLALAWVLNNPQVDCMLIGARNTEHIEQAMKASAMRFDAEWEAAILG